MEKREFKIIKTKRADGSIRIQTHNTMPSQTDASFTDDADVNKVVGKFLQNRDHSIFYRENGFYQDFTDMPTDLASAVERIQLAEDAFGALPSNVRERFANDPVRMVDFLQDPANRDEAVKLGMLNPPEPGPVDPQPAGDKAKPRQTPKSKPVVVADPPSDDE